jgi:hypothetical protein
MSSNNGGHKGWFYLKTDPEHALPEYIGSAITTTSRSWSNGPPMVDQEKLLKEHWAVLAHHRNAGVDLTAVISQYHVRGIIPL